jgi:tetratricopeptide (TPR) repeat protein
MAEYERAYALNPSDADLLADISEALVYVGRHGEAIQHVQRAMEINPHTPDWYRWDLGWAHYFAKDYEKALAALRQIPRPQPDVRLMLAAVLARLGQAKEAAAEMKRFRKARPGWTVASERLSVRFRDPADEEHWLQGARMAGLPEDEQDAAGTT